ncbi:hypothetical protein QJS66_15230 [Kocuria rhizophila]|nr:hypothetical protein QJS66_15230 [Kocuria rhizophila]
MLVAVFRGKSAHGRWMGIMAIIGAIVASPPIHPFAGVATFTFLIRHLAPDPRRRRSRGRHQGELPARRPASGRSSVPSCGSSVVCCSWLTPGRRPHHHPVAGHPGHRRWGVAGRRRVTARSQRKEDGAGERLRVRAGV